MVRVKICGITNLRDALAAAEAGADALGFNFWQGSPRYISPAAASKIVRRLPPMVVPVGLFVDERRQTVERIAGELGLRMVQLHGEESPDDIRVLTAHGIPVIKAFPVGEGFRPTRLRAYSAAKYFLLDAAVPGVRGGSGTVADWNRARQVARRAKVFLAGGLTPSNVARAVGAVRPFGVDVSSGVETRPGVKSLKRMSEFIRRAKAAG